METAVAAPEPKKRGRGRPFGSVAKSDFIARQRVRLTGIEPLDVLVTRMRWNFSRFENLERKAYEEIEEHAEHEAHVTKYLNAAASAAIEAAPYCHNRLASVDHRVSNSTVDVQRLTDAQLSAYLIDVTPNAIVDDKDISAVANTPQRSVAPEENSPFAD